MMTSFVFPKSEMQLCTITLPPKVKVFQGTTMQLLWTESGLMAEHNLLPHVQDPVHMLLSPLKNGSDIEGQFLAGEWLCAVCSELSGQKGVSHITQQTLTADLMMTACGSKVLTE